MRGLIPSVLTAEECSSLASTVGYLTWQDDRLRPVLSLLSSCLPTASTADPSYVRVEMRREGHPWHCDKGNRGHMAWCDYSASILLTEDFTGGEFIFENGKDEYRHYRDLLYYSRAERHMVRSHHGNRRVLLMFLHG